MNRFSQPDFLDKIDFIMSIYKEKIPDNGEDAYIYSANSQAALVGVFDGCGGAGAKKHTKLQGKTGAYAASRIVSAAVMDWFSQYGAAPKENAEAVLKQIINKKLKIGFDAVEESTALKSKMVKTFPTTAAFACCSEENGEMVVDYFWAGDSRVYLLDQDGLAQLSIDDLQIADAMDNLYEDGVMTNVISQSNDYVIHHSRIALKQPAMIFAATDGCFAYVSSPMEFEYMLLESLMLSQTVEQWEQELSRKIDKVAGDDYSLSALAFAYGGFDSLSERFHDRKTALYEKYISKMSGMDREEKNKLWDQYKMDYYRIIQP